MRQSTSIFLAGILGFAVLFVEAPGTSPASAEERQPLTYDLRLDTVLRGYDGKTCWVHPRAGLLPGPKPAVVMTMMKAIMSGSDVFLPVSDLRSDDLGKTWSKPHEHSSSFGRSKEPGKVELGYCDFTPAWHAKTGKLLAIGQTVRYRNEVVLKVRAREIAYSVYDESGRTWSRCAVVKMPDEARFTNCGAGSAQRIDLPDGTILLPVYFKKKEEADYRVAVLRCTFDGKELRVREVGDELSHRGGRGVYEPSLTRFGGKYYLTLRNDHAGYVATSDDGLHFLKQRKWLWDDGSDLGNYNTQQHWVTHGEGLHLVYTRKGAKNDHVMRHRAPLFMARVDPETLRVIRKSERILVPERGARLGNFGVVEVSPHETWVTVAEWMQTLPPQRILPVDNPYGSDNSVFVARIRWNRPNTHYGGGR